MTRLLRCCLLFACLSFATAAHAQSVIVFAAASLKNALDAATAQWTSRARFSIAYGASSMLAKQIENGAPAQVFICADLDWMDYLAARKLIRGDTRKNLFGNTLVLIAPADSRASVGIRPGFPLAALLGNGRLAIADPYSVPAGRYAKAALQKLAVWAPVADRLAASENVRATLALVARGEAPLGIVYGSDAAVEKKVRVLATFDPSLHPPIVYPAALTNAAQHPAAAEFLAYLSAPSTRKIFEAHGFTSLE